MRRRRDERTRRERRRRVSEVSGGGVESLRFRRSRGTVVVGGFVAVRLRLLLDRRRPRRARNALRSIARRRRSRGRRRASRLRDVPLRRVGELRPRFRRLRLRLFLLPVGGAAGIDPRRATVEHGRLPARLSRLLRRAHATNRLVVPRRRGGTRTRGRRRRRRRLPALRVSRFPRGRARPPPRRGVRNLPRGASRRIRRFRIRRATFRRVRRFRFRRLRFRRSRRLGFGLGPGSDSRRFVDFGFERALGEFRRLALFPRRVLLGRRRVRARRRRVRRFRTVPARDFRSECALFCLFSLFRRAAFGDCAFRQRAFTRESIRHGESRRASHRARRRAIHGPRQGRRRVWRRSVQRVRRRRVRRRCVRRG